MDDKPKHPGGRPTKYKSEYCEQLVEFMSREPYREVQDVFIDKNGNERINTRLVANDPPFITAFSRSIDVPTATLYEWGKVHPEFSSALIRARELQTEFIATNGMNGLFNPQFTKFAAVNMTDWRDKQETMIQGDKENPLQLESTMKIIHQRFPIQQIEE